MSILEKLSALPDQSLAFLANGYLFAERVREARGLDATDGRPLPLRLLGKPALLVRGREGVELFYDTARMRRRHAMPLFVRGPLFGHGAVHGLDGDEHLARKAMFVSIAYDDAQVARFKPILETELRTQLDRWAAEPGNVYDGCVEVYGRAALRWAGVEGADGQLDAWARRLGQIVEGFGHKDLRHIEAWGNRRRCDEWAADLVARVRLGELHPARETALAKVAAFRGPDGRLLDEHTAGVELQNATRPVIAVARFAAFAARNLVEHADYRRRLVAETAERGGIIDNPLAIAFAQETRRLSPFVPMLPAFARGTFEWAGQQIQSGQRVLLDILGTNVDPASWEDADRFYPERFLDVDAEAIETFVPQGGGDVRTGHRCPGEKIAVAALAATVSALCTKGVELNAKGLGFSWTSLPTRPKSGVGVRVVR